MADLVWVQWYATVLRQSSFADEVAIVAPLALRYGATQYQVHVSNDDRYRITQMSWFERRCSWIFPVTKRASASASMAW